jgi:hypothetical protein
MNSCPYCYGSQVWQNTLYDSLLASNVQAPIESIGVNNLPATIYLSRFLRPLSFALFAPAVVQAEWRMAGPLT